MQSGPRVGVLRAQHFFVDGEGALEEGFSLLIASLIPIEVSKIVQGGCGIIVFRTQHLFFDVERALEGG